MIKKIIFGFIIIFLAFISFQYFYGGRSSDVLPKTDFEVFAHRGVHVNWKKGTYDPVSGCEATHIYEPTHEYIENTIESIQAAFDMGATIVEVDIRRTSDDHLVVFHDGMLECRTNGQGRVSDHPLAYLKTLDIGYGYTHDDGKTFPFREKGIGKMPTLVEVLQAFPDRELLIHQKDNSLKIARLLVDIIRSRPPEQQKSLYFYGPDEVYAFIQEEMPFFTRLFATRRQIKNWFKKYLLTFGMGGFPDESRGLVLGMPLKYTKLVWGWPYRFLEKVQDAGAKFYLMVDKEEEIQKIADLPVDGIITDYIDVIGKYFRE